MKITPLIREIQKHPEKISYSLIHTGQHYDSAMSDVFFDELGIPDPDVHLDCGGGFSWNSDCQDHGGIRKSGFKRPA